jgi:hypothetical protein
VLKNRPGIKWLDLQSYCRTLLLPGQTLKRIRYFTAPVKPLPTDPGQPARQAAYLDAIQTLPSVSVHKGQFRVNPKPMPLEARPHTIVRVLHTEEKGSDVNLATYVLLDAFRDDAEVALIISDDFDLIEPLKRTRLDLDRVLGVASPRCRPALSRAVGAAFYRPIRPEVMSGHQLPASVTGPSGPIHRPREWR